MTFLFEEQNIKNSEELREVYTTTDLAPFPQKTPPTKSTITQRPVSINRVTRPPINIPDDYDWDENVVTSKVPETTPRTLAENHQTNENDKDQSKKKVNSEFDDLTGDRIGASCIAGLCGVGK